jgi:hypothetical protein
MEDLPRAIGAFLLKFEGKLPTPKKALKEAIEEFLGAPGVVQDVSISRGTLTVKAPAAARQALYQKKKDLVPFLRAKGIPIKIAEVR